MSRKRVTRFGACFTLLALFLSVPSVAEAASWNNISGTVIEGGAWYRSSVIRYKSGSGSIQIKLTNLPAQSDGVAWYLNSTSQGQPQIGSQLHISDSSTRTLANNVANSTQFQNNFKQWTATKGVGDYEFSGQENY